MTGDNNVLTYEGLKKYDELIKNYINRPKHKYKAAEEKLCLDGLTHPQTN